MGQIFITVSYIPDCISVSAPDFPGSQQSDQRIINLCVGDLGKFAHNLFLQVHRTGIKTGDGR